MSLGAHLKEARRRLIIAVIGLVLGMVVAIFVTDPVIWYITEPIRIIDAQRGTDTPFAQFVFSGISTGFDLRLRIAFAIGMLLSAPVWLWQIWAFIMPGPTRKEVRWSCPQRKVPSVQESTMPTMTTVLMARICHL